MISGDKSDADKIETTLIGPGGLEVDAVVPQCLDNQYISDGTYTKITTEDLDFRDETVRNLRERAFRTEFVRSLVYSSQVIIQRAFFKNSEFLYKNYLPDDRKNLSAFASLIRDRAIVPYLFRESSLYDNLTFDINEDGDRATQALLAEVGGGVTCVRLSNRDADNDTATASMATAFGAGLSRLAFMTPAQRNAMASELLADPTRLQETGAWEGFNAAVTDLAVYAVQRGAELAGTEGRTLTRQDVYLDKFVVERRPSSGPDERVKYGRLKSRSPENPFPFELKKYVDLVYNVNLPDYLRRFTFTPLGMPTRMAIQDAPAQGYGHDEVSELISDEDALESIRQTFMAHSRRAMSLPLLNELTVADVAELRQLDEWMAFKDSQSQILREPLRILEHMETFQSAFDEFQRALSSWYNIKYKRKETEDRYCSYISLALSLGGRLIIAGSDLGPYEKAATAFGVDQAVSGIPRRVKGYAAKLMVGVYDLGRRRLDADRTYTVELMQTNEELMREDVVELLRSIHRMGGHEVPGASKQVADQGIQ
jgi:hypothetical protein